MNSEMNPEKTSEIKKDRKKISSNRNNLIGIKILQWISTHRLVTRVKRTEDFNTPGFSQCQAKHCHYSLIRICYHFFLEDIKVHKDKISCQHWGRVFRGLWVGGLVKQGEKSLFFQFRTQGNCRVATGMLFFCSFSARWYSKCLIIESSAWVVSDL